MGRLRRLAPSLALLAAGLVVAWTLGEVLARSLNLVDRVNGFPRRLFAVTDDPHLPYVMRPGVDTFVRGVRVTVNEHGLRGPSCSTRSAPGVHRVLALGDSATFGEGLAVEEAFPALLERELSSRTGGRWEVLNAGVEGYNTEAELAWLRQRGLALAPEDVVVGFNLNDFDYAPVMGPLGILTTDQSERVGARSLRNRSELYLLLRWLVRTRARTWIDDHAVPERDERNFLPFDRAVSKLRKEYYRSPTDTRWGTLVDSLRGLGEEARAQGMRLVVAIIPDGDQVGVPEPDMVPQERLRPVCADLGLDCLDLYPAFAAAATEGAPLYLDIMHPNAAGQRIVAHALADRLLTAR